MAKDRNTALVLAVMFSFWTYLYSYKEDATKFWLHGILSIFLFWTLFVPLGFYAYAIYTVYQRDEKFYKKLK